MIPFDFILLGILIGGLLLWSWKEMARTRLERPCDRKPGDRASAPDDGS